MIKSQAQIFVRVAIVLAVTLLGAVPAIADNAPGVVTATNLSDPPTLRCRPQTPDHLSECAIFLPPGEELNPDKIIPDNKRWLLTPEQVGPANEMQTIVFAKEISDQSGISTVVYLLTDAPHGTYRLLIVSDPDAPLFSEVDFTHALTPAEHQGMLERRRDAATAQEQAAQLQSAVAAQLSNATSTLAEITAHPCTVHVDPRYTWHADSVTAAFAPAEVFLDDENHTCVQFREQIQVLPVPYINGARVRFHPRRGDNMLVLDGRQARFQLRVDQRDLDIEYVGK